LFIASAALFPDVGVGPKGAVSSVILNEGKLLDNTLIAELKATGTKVTEADLKLIVKDFDNKILFLEEGSSSSGLQHIIE